ncbi:MAG: AMP-binding protein [Clostridia bacterium]|nr:AMP-binding protein [Clostridia bacterium]
MKNTKLREKVEFKNVKDLVERVADMYRGDYVYSYKNNPRDKEVIKVKYEDFRKDVRGLATEFIARGFKGKHITVVGKLTYQWVLVYWATLSIGSVLVPLDPEWTVDDLADTIEKADSTTLFVGNDILEKGKNIKEKNGIEDFFVLEGDGEDAIFSMIKSGKKRIVNGDISYFSTQPDPDALSLLVFTSGTTGKGKGVMLNQTAVLSDLSDVVQYVDFGKKTIALLPPHHTYGSSVAILGQTSIGCEIYLSAGIKYIQKELKEQKPEHVVLVPLYLETFYRKIMANIKEQGKEKLIKNAIKASNGLRKIGIDRRKSMFKAILEAFGGKTKMVISGGAPISQEIMDFFDGVGISVLNGYGITECAPIIAVNHSKKVIPGSVGFPLEICDVRLDDMNSDGEGEICVKGSNVMLGYYKDEKATEEAFTSDGYFKTGDYGKFDKHGALHITGRKKNLIILSNGKNVYPEEIETVLGAVPGVLDIIVYEGQSVRGVEHNKIVAEIYPDKEYIEKNNIKDVEKYLQEFVNEYNRTAVPYKKIGIVKVRKDEFPKNTLRKILRFKLDMSID